VRSGGDDPLPPPPASRVPPSVMAALCDAHDASDAARARALLACVCRSAWSIVNTAWPPPQRCRDVVRALVCDTVATMLVRTTSIKRGAPALRRLCAADEPPAAFRPRRTGAAARKQHIAADWFQFMGEVFDVEHLTLMAMVRNINNAATSRQPWDDEHYEQRLARGPPVPRAPLVDASRLLALIGAAPGEQEAGWEMCW
jgi:hypothetical protein